MATSPHHQGVSGAPPPIGGGWERDTDHQSEPTAGRGGAARVPQVKVAARCIQDPAYALAILDGEDYPEVREAMLADLQEEMGDRMDGYLHPQPIPPGIQGWSRLALVRLHGLAAG